MATPPLPAGYALDDTPPLPAGYALDVGASQAPDQPSPGLLDRANQYAEKALSGAGLPTSISNIPDWFKHLTGTHPNSEPFWTPVRRAIANPTQENLVAAVPFVGPSSVAMAKDVQKGDYAGAAATLAGTVGGVVAPAKASAIAAGLSDTAATAKNLAPATKEAIAGIKPDLVAHLKKTHSLSGQAAAYLADKVLPDSAASIQAAEEAQKAKFENAQQRTDAIFQKAKDDAAKSAAKSKTAAAKAAAAPPQPLSPIYGPQTPTPEQLAQRTSLSSLLGEKPSGITVLPEPRAGLPGDVNLMGSVPRGTLQDLALTGKPGAGAQLQHLGQPVLYAPSGAGISNVKSAVALRDLLEAKPNMTLNPVGEGGARQIVPGNEFESLFGPEHKEVGDLAEWETGNREGVKVGSDLDKAAKSMFGGKSFDALTQAQKAHILRIAQTQVAVP